MSLVYWSDVRAAGLGCRTAVQWCRDHGIDPKGFIKNGVDESILIATGDAQALKVVEVARGRQ